MKTIGLSAALLVLLVLISIGSRDIARATTFTPTGYTVNLSNSAVSAADDITVSYTLDTPSALDDVHLSFLPSAFGVANGASVPNGALVGTLAITTTESQSNSPCSNEAVIAYQLLDATTDTTNILADSPRIPDANWPGFLDANSNGLPDAVDKYPNFLKTLYPGLTPRSRAYASVPSSIGTINRVVNVLVFDPGRALPGLSPLSPSLGYIVVVVQQDPTAPPAPSVVSVGCTFFQYNRQDWGLTRDNPNTAANEGNVSYRTNPATDGSFTFMEYLRSRRDMDNDGIENQLDTCPFAATPGWNPRISDPINDPDGDGIPGQHDPSQPGDQLLAGTGCDPTPLTANNDADGDGYVNRQDNCPLVANPTQADSDKDGIGDACDVLVNVPDGHLHEVCLTASVNVGSGGTPTTPACLEMVPDMDNDGFVRTIEEHVGTDPQKPCGQTGWPADIYSTGMSLNRVDIQDLTSFIAPVRHLNTNLGTFSGDNRWDLVPGPGLFAEDINIQDMTALIVLYPPMLQGARAFGGPPCPYPP